VGIEIRYDFSGVGVRGVKFWLLGSSLLVRYYDFHRLYKTGRAKEKRLYFLRDTESC